MDINKEQLNDDIIKINLSGRMDVGGVGEIEAEFSTIASTVDMSIIVDMSAVPYMSSIGIRALLINAKAVNRRGQKYALLTPQSDVKNVLEVSGIDQLITICGDIDEAISKVSS